MTRTLPTARTPRAPMLVALLAVLACVLPPGVASADVEIPLASAISPQYHGVDVDAAVDSAAAAIPAEAPAAPALPPAPPAPALKPPAPAPEPEYHPEITPRYHSEEAPNNSDKEAPAEPAPEPVREEPAPDPPSVEQDEPPAAAAGVTKEPGRAVELPKVAGELPGPRDELPDDAAGGSGIAGAGGALPVTALEIAGIAGAGADVAGAPLDLASALSGTAGAPGDAGDALPVIAGVGDAPPDLGTVIPKAAGPVTVPTVPSLGNLNISLRIFSPGDDGPVTQIINGGGSSAISPIAAPMTWTWIWNWTWTGSGCDAGMPGFAAPELGVAGWNWNWVRSCGAGAPTVPGVDDLLGLGRLPGLATFPSIEALVESLPSLDSLPSIDYLAGAGMPAIPISNFAGFKSVKPVAGAPESRAGRERSGGSSLLAPRGGSAAWAQSPSAIALEPAAVVAGDSSAADRPATRRTARDISRKRRAIPADEGPAGVPIAAAAAASAAAGSGGPAALTVLILIFMSFLASALLAGVGLPRLQPRSSRLERPG